LEHYLEFGRQEGRAIRPVLLSRSNTAGSRRSARSLKSQSSTRLNEIEVAEHIRFPITSEPDISIIIPVYNQLPYTLNCLLSLSEQKCTSTFEVIVMDDSSTDTTSAALQRIQGLRYFRNDVNMGFIRTCN